MTTTTPRASGAHPVAGNGAANPQAVSQPSGRAPDRAIVPASSSSWRADNGVASSTPDELKPQVREVEAARARLGEDLERLNYEVRAQMGVTVEKLAWKAAVVGSSVLAALATQKMLTAGWKAAKHTDPPTNPADPQTSWPDALVWTLATAATAAVAKIFAARAAASGWEKATGSLPPGLKT